MYNMAVSHESRSIGMAFDILGIDFPFDCKGHSQDQVPPNRAVEDYMDVVLPE